jgi:hypothetical protein
MRATAFQFSGAVADKCPARLELKFADSASCLGSPCEAFTEEIAAWLGE